MAGSAVPAIMIIDVHVLEHRRYAEYVERVKPLVESHGGRYLVRGGEVIPLSGDWRSERIVVIGLSIRAQVTLTADGTLAAASNWQSNRF